MNNDISIHNYGLALHVICDTPSLILSFHRQYIATLLALSMPYTKIYFISPYSS